MVNRIRDIKVSAKVNTAQYNKIMLSRGGQLDSVMSQVAEHVLTVAKFLAPVHYERQGTLGPPSLKDSLIIRSFYTKGGPNYRIGSTSLKAKLYIEGTPQRTIVSTRDHRKLIWRDRRTGKLVIINPKGDNPAQVTNFQKDRRNTEDNFFREAVKVALRPYQ